MQIKLEDVVDLELDAGDVSIHHPNIVHGSEPNTSDRRRAGLTIRYISPATECTDPEQVCTSPNVTINFTPNKHINAARHDDERRPRGGH